MLAAIMRVDEVLGSPVINYLPETHTFVLENNCLYNNYAGNYFNCASTTDIYVDPVLLNQNWYRIFFRRNSKKY